MGKVRGICVENTSRTLTDLGLSTGSTLFPADSVIVSTRAPIGYVLINKCPMCTNQGCKTLVSDGRILPAYLCHNLRGRTAELNALGSGTTFKELSTECLKNLTIPLPPLPVQREIVARLERELAEADRLAANFKRIAELADAEFKAELEGVITDKHGKLVRLGDVCKVDGVLVKDVKKYEFFPHIGIDCIEKDTGRLLAYRTVGEDAIKSGKYHFSNRHIIYSKIRPNLNKVAVPEFEGLCSADSYPILPSEQCNRYWLAYLMRSAVFLNYAVPISNTRTGMPKINRDELLGFQFRLPPLEEQRKIVAKLDAKSSRCKYLKAAAERGLRAAENLRAAILSEAFAQ